jgi:hypothetical protein
MFYNPKIKNKCILNKLQKAFNIWYDNFYLPETYNVLITDLIPKARNQMEELLDR